MHDPMTVALEIRRPWPKRSGFSATSGRGGAVRWRIRLHHDCGTWCADTPPHKSGAFPWWKPASYSAFWQLGGREFYWPPLVTVWHHDPSDYDHITCDKKRWRLHVHHWRIKVPALQRLRRRLLTRCAWCNGRDRKGDPVNISHSWDGPDTPWWRGDPHLFHRDCSSIERAHAVCTCEHPVLPAGSYRDRCRRCMHPRPNGLDEERLAHLRSLARIPHGERSAT